MSNTTKSQGRRSLLVRNNSATATAPTAKSEMQRFTFNISTKKVRKAEMEGRPYVVVPMVMMVEGVHNGSRGPLFYPGDELSKAPATWNLKPIVVYHPDDDQETACTPEFLTERKVGVIMNTRFDSKGRLIAEAWLEEHRMKSVDMRVWDAVQNGKMLELSTGVFTENEEVEGDFAGEHYIAIARNHKPDHLALLPDQIGACSINDGAGFIRNAVNAFADGMRLQLSTDEQALATNLVREYLGKQRKEKGYLSKLLQNEASFEQIRESLCLALQGRYPAAEGYAMPWVEAVYEDRVVYCIGSKTFSLPYSISEASKVTFTGDPTEVMRVTEYRAVANQATDGTPTTNNSNQDQNMDKKKIVDGLIANCGYKESDRPWLMGLNDEQLTKVNEAATSAVEVIANKAKTEATAAKPETAKPAQNAAPAAEAAPAQRKEITVDEYVANAPAAVQDVLKNSLAMHAAEKKRLVDAIVANTANEFTRAELEAKDLGELKKLEALIAKNTRTENDDGADFSALGETRPAQNADQGEALATPGLVFSK